MGTKLSSICFAARPGQGLAGREHRGFSLKCDWGSGESQLFPDLTVPSCYCLFLGGPQVENCLLSSDRGNSCTFRHSSNTNTPYPTANPSSQPVFRPIILQVVIHFQKFLESSPFSQSSSTWPIPFTADDSPSASHIRQCFLGRGLETQPQSHAPSPLSHLVLAGSHTCM
jgi:hypothetical protein